MEQENINEEIIPVDKAKIKKIWTVTGILFIATVIEFIFAFTMGAGTARTIIFILLTIFKAFYIVGEFMHLSHEKKGLIYSIALPCIFILWLILALLMQGSAIFEQLGLG